MRNPGGQLGDNRRRAPGHRHDHGQVPREPTGEAQVSTCQRTTLVSSDIELSFWQLVVLDWHRLPLNFPRPVADGLLADMFMQPGKLLEGPSECSGK